MQSPVVSGKQMRNVEFGQANFDLTFDTIFAIISGQGNAQSKWCIADWMIEIVLGSDCGSFL